MRLLLLLVLILTSFFAFSQIINIPADYPTIQQGINAANNGDTVLVDPGTYIENINFYGKSITVASNFLLIQDTSFIFQTIIDGNNNGRVVTFQTYVDTTALLCGFTLQNGFADNWNMGGSIYCIGANPTLSYCRIMYNESSRGGGGGIYCENAFIRMSNLDIISNSVHTASGSGGLGGGLYCVSSSVSMSNCYISENTAGTLGGGICCESSSLYLENVKVMNNTAYDCIGSGNGGGIYAANSDLTLKSVSILNNYALGVGGLLLSNTNVNFDSLELCNIYNNNALSCMDISSSNPNTVVIVDTFSVITPTDVFASPIENFSFNIQHGIIQQENADLYVSPDGNNANSGLSQDEPLQTIHFAFLKILSDSADRKKIHLLEGTYSDLANGEDYPIYMIDNVDLVGTNENLVILDGGGQKVLVLGGEVYISGLTITGGHNWYFGGGLICNDATGVVKNLIIKNNYAGSDGGGILIQGDTCPVFVNVQIKDNKAMIGSGIYCTAPNLNLINVLVSDNSGVLANEGGECGIYLSGSNAKLFNCSIVNNGNRGILCGGTDPVLYNTIIWSHEEESIRFEDTSTMTISCSDIELGEEGISTPNNGSIDWLAGNINESPMFVSTGGHPYQINEYSPCKDAGTPDTTGLNLPAYDLAGEVRIFNYIVDMGAYEWNMFVRVNPIITKKTKLEVQNQPNPFSASTTIEYELQLPEKVILTIYDYLGKQLYQLQENQPQGNQQLIWNAARYAEGVYYYRLQVGDVVANGKMVKVK